MRKIGVTNSVSLDGVMQAPGRPDEDTRDGFDRGGWGIGYQDDVMGRELGEGMAGPVEMLFGRRTFVSLGQYWPHHEGPVSDMLNATRKHVVTNTLHGPQDWQNTTLVPGDAAQTVAVLKGSDGPDLMILGSGELIRTLERHDLIDTYQLLIHPLLLGTGRRMFPDGTPPRDLRLVSSVPTTRGVIMAQYART